MSLPTDPITGQSAPYSNDYLNFANNVYQQGSFVPYSPKTIQYYGYGGVLDGQQGSAGGTLSSGSADQQQSNLINQAFDTQIAGLQSQLGLLGKQQDNAELGIQKNYQNKANDLNYSYNSGMGNLADSRQQVNYLKEKSLKDILDQLRIQSQSYNNQLGAYGAGDSSAVGMINQALGARSTKNRGDVLYNSGQQIGAIDDQQQNLQHTFDSQTKQLNDWKDQSLSQLALDYTKQKQAIRAEMKNADYQRYQQLSQYDASMTQKAIAQLADLEGMYKQQAADLLKQYKNFYAPQTISIDPSLTKYQVAPIDAGTLRGLAMPDQVNPENSVLSLFRRRPEDQAALGQY